MIGSQPVTAFLSNIPAGTPEDLILSILCQFGQIVGWRRLKEPSGALKPSGFVDFDTVESAQKAARLLPLVDLYQHGKRLLIKLDTAAAGSIMASNTSNNNTSSNTSNNNNPQPSGEEEGEVPDSKQQDIAILESLGLLFHQRRMLFAQESCKSLIRDYDHILAQSHQVVNAQGDHTHDDHERHFEEMERAWLRREERIFADYHRYMNKVRQADMAADRDNLQQPIIHMYHHDRQAFCQRYPDRDYAERVKRIVEGMPTDPEDLFNQPVDWSRLCTGKLRQWFVKQRSLSASSADIVVSWFARRLSPKDMEKDPIEGVDDMHLFVVRLWRWLLLDTQL